MPKRKRKRKVGGSLRLAGGKRRKRKVGGSLGLAGGKKKLSRWNRHVRRVSKANPSLSFKQVIAKAVLSYKR